VSDDTPNVISCQEMTRVLVWGTMEIALLTKSGIRIKGKQGVVAIDPADKANYEATLLLEKSAEEVSHSDESLMITGAGEFEIGGIKMTGMRSEKDLLYSITVDGVEVLVGKLASLEKMQHKLKDHHIVLVDCVDTGNASFITSLAEKVVMFYGAKADEISASFGKENVKKMNKFSSTKDKLPAEVETILLANS
jgi:hypothetical protein